MFENAPLLAACRWFEPDTGEEAAVVVTNAIRSNGDGGRGVVYKVVPGGEPIVIPLNGHDVWGDCRLVPSRNALLLLRHGPKRFYIVGSTDLDPGTDVITTRVAHGFSDGDLVIVRQDGETLPEWDNGGASSSLVNGAGYWVDVQSSTTFKLCSDSSLTVMDFLTAGGRFIIEAATLDPTRLDFDPATLVCQGSQVSRAWDNGFDAVPQSVSASVADGGSTWTADNHGFENGAAIELTASWTHSTGALAAGTTAYAHFITPHQFSIHTTAALALLGTTALVDAGGSGTITRDVKPDGYSGQPMVPLREAVVHQNRTIGVNGRVRLAISDPGDFLHFTPFTGAKNVVMGNGDELIVPVPLGEDSLLLPTRSQVLAVTGLNSTDTTNWLLRQVTREYGFIAPLATIQVGRDVWGLSQPAGVMSVRTTDYGQNQGVSVPVSFPIQTKIDAIDWRYAHRSCAAWFGNKYIIAVPLKGQEDAVKNNCLLVYNFLTQAWDHYWQGTGLHPIQFFRLTISGQERLCWIDADGAVKWFTDDGWDDITLEYEDEEWTYGSSSIDSYVVTRGYTCGHARMKNWHAAEVTLAHINPEFSITAITEGYNQETVYRDGITKDPQKWLTFNQTDFHPVLHAALSGAPWREDYSMLLGEGLELIPAGAEYAAMSGAPAGYKYRLIHPHVVAGETYTVTGGAAETGLVLLDANGNFSGTQALTAGVATDFTPDYAEIRFYGPSEVAVTATVTLDGLELDEDTGPPPDAHQTIVELAAMRERSRILQLKLANTQGSTRWRSVVVAAKPERGDF